MLYTKFLEASILRLKTYIDPNILKVRDFNSTVLPMNRSSRQKLNREIMKPTGVMTQMDLIDIYKTFHPNRKEYTFSAAYGTFSEIVTTKSDTKQVSIDVKELK